MLLLSTKVLISCSGSGPCGENPPCINDTECASTARCQVGCCVPDRGIPIVDAGADQTVVSGERVFLRGTAQDNGGADSLSFAWSLIAGPPTAQVVIEDAGSQEASFIAPAVDGEYRFRLEVQDRDGNIQFDDVLITITCISETDVTFCGRNGANCGALTAQDNCGQTRSIASCGTCQAPNTCGGGSVDNMCGCSENDRAFCTRLGADCGPLVDFDICDTQRSIFCGTCEAPDACGFGNDPNICGSIAELSLGGSHSCLKTSSGRLRCWGANESGQLGYGNTANIGDDEVPAVAGDVNVGGFVEQVVAGDSHTCALLRGGVVRCWGSNQFGQLGYPNIANVGITEQPAAVDPVDVGGTVIQLAASGFHTCALLDTRDVRCWGWGFRGQLGYGDEETIGDDETPASAGNVNVGGAVVQIAASDYHTCAVLETNKVRCWGWGNWGQLGYGNTDNIGDDEPAADAGDVPLGNVDVQRVEVAATHTCALTTTGDVRCWGFAGDGQLGYGNFDFIGDDEPAGNGGEVDIPELVTQIGIGEYHSCALLSTKKVRCWGRNDTGQLGTGVASTINEPSPDIDAGENVEALAVGAAHTCVLLTSGNVRCWGLGASGRLGYGNTQTIGRFEAPSSVGPAQLF